MSQTAQHASWRTPLRRSTTAFARPQAHDLAGHELARHPGPGRGPEAQLSACPQNVSLASGPRGAASGPASVGEPSSGKLRPCDAPYGECSRATGCCLPSYSLPTLPPERTAAGPDGPTVTIPWNGVYQDGFALTRLTIGDWNRTLRVPDTALTLLVPNLRDTLNASQARAVRQTYAIITALSGRLSAPSHSTGRQRRRPNQLGGGQCRWIHFRGRVGMPPEPEVQIRPAA